MSFVPIVEAAGTHLHLRQFHYAAGGAARFSDFIQHTELPTALARSDAKQCTMLWVPLERNDLEAKHPLEQRLKKLQCATRDARPVYDFEIVQKGWMEVEQAIRRAVEVRRKFGR
ncbi:MAG: hypothetical protein WCF18_06100 [Chthoniobacteraceae bacterium]